MKQKEDNSTLDMFGNTDNTTNMHNSSCSPHIKARVDSLRVLLANLRKQDVEAYRALIFDLVSKEPVHDKDV